jgi:3-oxoacyl-[acyl-carrier-protein] synthase II
VAVVVEPRDGALRRGARPYADLGGYARGVRPEEAAGAVRQGPVDLWLPPDGPPGGGAAPVGTARPIDLAARLGRSAGALGVLQCAVAALLIDGGEARSALAACGGAEGTDAAALALLAPPGPEPGRAHGGATT